MAVTYEGLGVRPVGTMTCDRGCGAKFHDGQAETVGPLIHVRAHDAGWKSVRPNAYRQEDVCPRCPTEVPDFDMNATIKAIGRQQAAMSMYAENDGQYPDDAPVLVPFPLNAQDPREAWPWVPGHILGQCPRGIPQEWHVVIDGRGDLAEPDPDDPREWLYPVCFRTADEIQRITDEEWARQSVPEPETEKRPNAAARSLAEQHRTGDLR